MVVDAWKEVLEGLAVQILSDHTESQKFSAAFRLAGAPIDFDQREMDPTKPEKKKIRARFSSSI